MVFYFLTIEFWPICFSSVPQDLARASALVPSGLAGARNTVSPRSQPDQ
jgi:hypothetical protein